MIGADNTSSEAARAAAGTSHAGVPMRRPLVAGTCPCGRPGGDDGFCDEHAGAVAFKVPIGPGGEVLPAVWWHWPHPGPCPQGDAWVIQPPAAGSPNAVWACAHRTHQIPEEATG